MTERNAAQRRVLRQLVESLVYEGALDPEIIAGRFTIRRRFSFGRVQVDGGDGTVSPSSFLDEVAAVLTPNPDRPDPDRPDPEQVSRFADELERTVDNDTQALRSWRKAARPASPAGYDDLESLIIDGHRYLSLIHI